MRTKTLERMHSLNGKNILESRLKVGRRITGFWQLDCVMEIKWEFSVNNVFLYIVLYIQGAQLLVDIESAPDKMIWFNKVFDNGYNSPLDCERDQWLGHFVSLMSHLFCVPLESHCSLSLLDSFHCTQIPLDSSQCNLTPQYPLDTSQYPLLGSPPMN